MLKYIELSTPPFRGKLLTFSESPEWHNVKLDDSLWHRVRDVSRMKWGMTTNLHKVYYHYLMYVISCGSGH
jgi:hypothetical protein